MSKEKIFGAARHSPRGEWVQTTIVNQVAGILFRRSNVIEYCDAVRKADRKGLVYTVKLRPEPTQTHGPNAIAIYGLVRIKSFFGTKSVVKWHIGYVGRELANELQEDLLSKGIPIAAELYDINQSGQFIDINYLVLAPPGHGLRRRVEDRQYQQWYLDTQIWPIH